jgi:hypothetical protein
MNLARYTIPAATSSAVGLIRLGGSKKPYCKMLAGVISHCGVVAYSAGIPEFSRERPSNVSGPIGVVDGITRSSTTNQLTVIAIQTG